MADQVLNDLFEVLLLGNEGDGLEKAHICLVRQFDSVNCEEVPGKNVILVLSFTEVFRRNRRAEDLIEHELNVRDDVIDLVGRVDHGKYDELDILRLLLGDVILECSLRHQL